MANSFDTLVNMIEQYRERDNLLTTELSALIEAAVDGNVLVVPVQSVLTILRRHNDRCVKYAAETEAERAAQV